MTDEKKSILPENISENELNELLADDEEFVETFDCEGCGLQFDRTESEIEQGFDTQYCDNCIYTHGEVDEDDEDDEDEDEDEDEEELAKLLEEEEAEYEAMLEEELEEGLDEEDEN